MHQFSLLAGWMLAIVSACGFVTMALLWGKLEYGLIGYLVAWGPFVAAFCAAVLLTIAWLTPVNR